MNNDDIRNEEQSTSTSTSECAEYHYSTKTIRQIISAQRKRRGDIIHSQSLSSILGDTVDFPDISIGTFNINYIKTLHQKRRKNK